VVRAESYELRQSDRAFVLRGGVRGELPEKAKPPAQGREQGAGP
jgi:hypothetical protein